MLPGAGARRRGPKYRWSRKYLGRYFGQIGHITKSVGFRGAAFGLVSYHGCAHRALHCSNGTGASKSSTLLAPRPGHRAVVARGMRPTGVAARFPPNTCPAEGRATGTSAEITSTEQHDLGG